MARWSDLTAWLTADGGVVRLTYAELGRIVGPLPASATDHRAWWSGDRTHTRTWRSAGYEVAQLTLGHSVTFAPTAGVSEPRRPVTQRAAVPAVTAAMELPVDEGPDLLLVTCVKSKLGVPAAARDLYISDLFRKQRSYAESLGVPWFILSAEHGLVAPDEWLAPYERYLPDTPPSYRAAWGAWVAARLDLLNGGLTGTLIEVHAAADYVDAVRPELVSRGARLITPLSGLAQGKRLAWYQNTSSPGRDGRAQPALPHASTVSAAEVDRFVAALSEESRALRPVEFLSLAATELDEPGLYSWWVDPDGAKDLSAGLESSVPPGLVYAGLAGATRWPSGRASSNTLRSRIAGMHLGGRHEFSTFRRSLGAVLAAVHRQDRIDEDELTRWMHARLRVVAIPCADPDTLGRLESDVLTRLNPPLNLRGMPRTPVRERLTSLRKKHSGRSTRLT
jgi:hypothetical protein